MNLRQHLEEIKKRLNNKWPAIDHEDWIGTPPSFCEISSFIRAEAIKLVKKAFEETQLQEADRTVVDDNILQQLTVNGITIGWNDARSAILEKQNLYLNEKTEK